MSLREALLLAGLLAAGAAVVRGIELLHRPSAWIVAGVLLAAVTILFTAEAD